MPNLNNSTQNSIIVPAESKNQQALEQDISKELEAIKVNFTEDEIDSTLKEIIKKISNKIGEKYIEKLRKEYEKKGLTILKTENIILNNICLTFKDALLSLKEKYNEILTLEQNQLIDKTLEDVKALENDIQIKIKEYKGNRSNRGNRANPQREATNKKKSNENEKIFSDFIKKMEANRIEVELNKKIDTTLKTIEEIKNQQSTDNENISQNFQAFLKYIDNLANNKEYDLVEEHQKKIHLIKSYVTNFISTVEAEIKSKETILEEQQDKQVDHELNKRLNDISDLITANNIKKTKGKTKDLKQLEQEQQLQKDLVAKSYTELEEFESQYSRQLTKEQITRINIALAQLRKLTKDLETKIKSINNKQKRKLVTTQADQEIDQILADISETISEDKLNNLRVAKTQEDKLKEEIEIKSIIKKQSQKLTNFKAKKRLVQLTEAQNKKIQAMLDKISELSNNTNQRIAELKLDEEIFTLMYEILDNINEKKINDTRKKNKEQNLILKEFYILNTIIAEQYKKLDYFERKYGKDTPITEKQEKDNIHNINLTEYHKKIIDDTRKLIDKAHVEVKGNIHFEVLNIIFELFDNTSTEEEQRIRKKYKDQSNSNYKPKEEEIFIRDCFFGKEYNRLLAFKEECSVNLSEDSLQNIDKTLTQLKESMNSCDLIIKGYLLDEISTPILELYQKVEAFDEQNKKNEVPENEELDNQNKKNEVAEKKQLNDSYKTLNNQLTSFQNSNKESLTEEEKTRLKELEEKLSKIKEVISANTIKPKTPVDDEVVEDLCLDISAKTKPLILENSLKQLMDKEKNELEIREVMLDDLLLGQLKRIEDFVKKHILREHQKLKLDRTRIEINHKITETDKEITRIHKDSFTRLNNTLKKTEEEIKYKTSQEFIEELQNSLTQIHPDLPKIRINTKLEATFSIFNRLIKEKFYYLTFMANKKYIHTEQLSRINRIKEDLILIANDFSKKIEKLQEEEFIENQKGLELFKEALNKDENEELYYFINQMIIELSSQKIKDFLTFAKKSEYSDERSSILLVEYYNKIKNKISKFQENNQFSLTYNENITIDLLLNFISKQQKMLMTKIKILEAVDTYHMLNYLLYFLMKESINPQIDDKLLESFYDIKIKEIEEINRKYLYNTNSSQREEMEANKTFIKGWKKERIERINETRLSTLYNKLNDALLSEEVKDLEKLKENLVKLTGQKLFQGFSIIKDALSMADDYLIILEKNKHHFTENQIKKFDQIIDMKNKLNYISLDLLNGLKKNQSITNQLYIILHDLLTISQQQKHHIINQDLLFDEIIIPLQIIRRQNQINLTQSHKDTISIIEENITKVRDLNELKVKIAKSFLGNEFAIEEDLEINQQVIHTISVASHEIRPEHLNFVTNDMKDEGKSEKEIDNYIKRSILNPHYKKLSSLLETYKGKLTEYQQFNLYMKILEIQHIYNDLKVKTKLKKEDILKNKIQPFIEVQDDIVSELQIALIDVNKFMKVLSSHLNKIKKNMTDIREYMRDLQYSEAEIDNLILNKILKPSSDCLYNYLKLNSKTLAEKYKKLINSTIETLSIIETRIITEQSIEVPRNNIVDYIVKEIVKSSSQQYTIKKIEDIREEFINKGYGAKEFEDVIINNFLKPKIIMLTNFLEANKTIMSYDNQEQIVKQINSLEGIEKHLLDYRKYQKEVAKLNNIEDVLLDREHKFNIKEYNIEPDNIEEDKIEADHIKADYIESVMQQRLYFLQKNIMESLGYVLNILDKKNDNKSNLTIPEDHLKRKNTVLTKLIQTIINVNDKIYEIYNIIDNLYDKYANKIIQQSSETELHKLPSTKLMDFYEKLIILREENLALENKKSTAKHTKDQVFEKLSEMIKKLIITVKDLTLEYEGNKDLKSKFTETESLLKNTFLILVKKGFDTDYEKNISTDSPVEVDELNIIKKDIEYVLSDSHLNMMLKYYKDKNLLMTDIEYRMKFIYQNICDAKISRLKQCYGDNLTKQQDKEITQYYDAKRRIMFLTEEQIYQGQWSKRDSNFNTIEPKQNNKNQGSSKGKKGKGVSQGSSKNADQGSSKAKKGNGANQGSSKSQKRKGSSQARIL